jgi:hypothetical protein
MFEILLSTWTTYLFLAWLAIVVVANLWPRKKNDIPPKAARPAQKRAESEFATRPFMDEIEPVQRERNTSSAIPKRTTQRRQPS